MASGPDEAPLEGLAPPGLAPEATGRGVRIAVVDTGVNFAHPHLRVPGQGWSVGWLDGAIDVRPTGYADRYGHGTCCAALIHALAPEAALWAVRVTAEQPTTDADRIAAGIEVAVEAGADLISIALGTRTRLRAGLDGAVRAAAEAGAVVVASDPGDEAVLPAGCPDAVAVRHQDGVDVVAGAAGWLAEGRARPAPGHATNFWGPSLACARAAAALARWAEQTGLRGSPLVDGFSKALVVR